MLEFKCQQLEKQVSMLKQQLEFRNMERDEYKDREIQLKRVNESLVKALEEQKPQNQNLTEVKLLVEQYGGGEKERQLEAELDRLKRNIQNEVSERVRAIVLQSEIKFKTCSRCKQLDKKNSQLQLQILQLKSKSTSQIQYTDDIQSKYSNAMDQLQIKQNKLLQLELQFKQYQEDTNRELGSKKTHQINQNDSVIFQLKRKISDVEKKKDDQFTQYKRQLQKNLEATLQQQIYKVEKKYEEIYHQKVIQLQSKIQREREILYNKEEDLRQKASRMTPIKILTYNETEVYNQPQQFRTSRVGVSPTWRKQNKNYNANSNTMQGEIKSLINVITRNKQQQFRGGESQISGYSTGGYYQQNDGSEYSNFSIKDAIVKPNNLMQNHYRLKNGRYN